MPLRYWQSDNRTSTAVLPHIYEPVRKGIWPDHTPVARKLYGSLRDLRCTATFIKETGVSSDEREEEEDLQLPMAVWQHVQLSEQIHLLVCCFGVKQASKQPTNNNPFSPPRLAMLIYGSDLQIGTHDGYGAGTYRLGSVLGLVGWVSVYLDCMRLEVWSAASVSVWLVVQLSEQICL